ncbi:MAG: thioredoxin [Nanoarchaeota archaeon]|nr:thioredoxin [Nanoarchaeota archaeon]
MESVTELDNGNEFKEFTEKGLVLVDFWADWCMPCLIMAPVMEELGKKFRGKVKFGKIDVDENGELAQKFRIMSIPNFVLFRDGKPIDQFIGSMPAEDFEEKLRKHL